MASDDVKRRDFCLHACRTVGALTLVSAFDACGGNSPTAPSQPPPTGGTPPIDAPPPAPPTPPDDSAPPPTSPTVTTLPLVAAALVQGALRVTIDGASPLAALWGAALTQVTVDGVQRSVLLARTGSSRFSALSGICTHEGCVVSRYATPIFVCPCHGSRYDTNGSVVQGPAPAALPRLSTEFVDGVLIIRL